MTASSKLTRTRCKDIMLLIMQPYAVSWCRKHQQYTRSCCGLGLASVFGPPYNRKTFITMDHFHNGIAHFFYP